MPLRRSSSNRMAQRNGARLRISSALSIDNCIMISLNLSRTFFAVPEENVRLGHHGGDGRWPAHHRQLWGAPPRGCGMEGKVLLCIPRFAADCGCDAAFGAGSGVEPADGRGGSPAGSVLEHMAGLRRPAAGRICQTLKLETEVGTARRAVHRSPRPILRSSTAEGGRGDPTTKRPRHTAENVPIIAGKASSHFQVALPNSRAIISRPSRPEGASAHRHRGGLQAASPSKRT